jgi:S1-C subfamily serine protease
MKFKILSICLFLLFALTACGSGDSGKVSKGHRDAIHIECADDPDKKLCGAEVRKAFIEDGNEFVTFDDLNKDQKRRVKMECVRSRKYGLETYNNCLAENKVAALDGTLTQQKIAKKPKNNIEDLEKSVVRVAITEYDADKKKEKKVGGGSGIILDKNYIATNCHVALIAEKGFERLIWVTNLSDKGKWANAVIYKKNPGKDVCVLQHQPVEKLSITMNPVRKIKKFSKLKRGDFVRTLGTPKGLMGHTAEGSINYLGKRPFEDFDEDTKFIVHDATIDNGSSGGPLFDKNGYLIGLNTLKAGNMYFSVSADYILEMIR